VMDGVRSFRNFPVLVEELTSRRTSVSYEIHAACRPLTSLTRMREDMYWPSPDDTRKDIERFASEGFYDSLFILWPQQNLIDGTSVRSAGGDWEWGLPLGQTERHMPP
jgi:hypothetical protein